MSKYARREWAPDEKPMLPGSPSTPAQPTPLRFADLRGAQPHQSAPDRALVHQRRHRAPGRRLGGGWSLGQ